MTVVHGVHIKTPKYLPIIWDSVWTFYYLEHTCKVHSCVPFLTVSWKLVLDSIEVHLQNMLELSVCSYLSTKTARAGIEILTYISILMVNYFDTWKVFEEITNKCSPKSYQILSWYDRIGSQQTLAEWPTFKSSFKNYGRCFPLVCMVSRHAPVLDWLPSELCNEHIAYFF